MLFRLIRFTSFQDRADRGDLNLSDNDSVNRFLVNMMQSVVQPDPIVNGSLQGFQRTHYGQLSTCTLTVPWLWTIALLCCDRYFIYLAMPNGEMHGVKWYLSERSNVLLAAVELSCCPHFSRTLYPLYVSHKRFGTKPPICRIIIIKCHHGLHYLIMIPLTLTVHQTSYTTRVVAIGITTQFTVTFHSILLSLCSHPFGELGFFGECSHIFWNQWEGFSKWKLCGLAHGLWLSDQSGDKLYRNQTKVWWIMVCSESSMIEAVPQ